MHFYGWKAGLKTGMYYLRTRPAAQAIQFTVDTALLKEVKANNQAQQAARAGKAAATTEAPASSTTPPPAKVNGITNGVNGISETSNSLPTPATSNSDLKTNGDIVPAATSSAASTPSSSAPLTGLDDRTAKAAEQDPEFAAALQRQRDRELEQAKLMCSIENKEACLMCSG